jgi:hypothetical protein
MLRVGSAAVMSLLMKIRVFGSENYNNNEYEVQITYSGPFGYLYGRVPVLGDK